MASTNGLDHGSCAGPLGLDGAAGFAPGGGGGGLGVAAFGSAAWGGFGGSAGFSVCCLSFCSSSATFKSLGRTKCLKERRSHKDVDSTTSVAHCQRRSLNA